MYFVLYLLVFGIVELHARSLTKPADMLFRWTVPGSEDVAKSSFDRKILCRPCEIGVMLARSVFKFGILNADEFASVFAKGCRLLQVEHADVCEGIAMYFKDEIYEVLRKSPVSSMEICAVLFIPECISHDDPKMSWNVSLPDIPKPPVVPPVPPSRTAPKLRVLHLSDIHVDFHYKIGSNAECDRPFCCQDNYNSEKKFRPAGKWGDYGWCDVPAWTVENLFEFLANQTPFDYIVWTGDEVSHLDWNITRQDQLRTLDYVSRLFVKYFPGVPVLPGLGNHEGVPVNSFPPPFTVTGNLSTDWLFEALVASWSHWLPNDTAATLLRGGYYTVLLKPGFRVVSLNMNYCNTGNWWLLLNWTDPGSQLRWLIGILQHAETSGEKVHIIGHIPPGQAECFKAWSWNYYRIINRYEGVVAAQMFGHSHWDSWEIFYDEETGFKRALSVAYIAPSVTTLIGMNPGFRVYEIDGFYPNSSWAVLNHETFVMNLTEANSFGRPVWKKEYSAKEAYGMKSLYPADWDAVYRRMFTDDRLFSSFYRFHYKLNDADKECDRRCRLSLLCSIRSGRSHDPELCAEVFSSGGVELDADGLRRAYDEHLELSRQRSFC